MNSYTPFRLRPAPRFIRFAPLRGFIRPKAVSARLGRITWPTLGTITLTGVGLMIALVVLSSWIGHPVIVAGLMILLVFGVCVAAYVLDEPTQNDR